MNKPKALVTTLTAALALAALLLVGVSSSAALPSYEPANPTEAECQPGQPYNSHCPTIVTFAFPKRSFFAHGRVKLVHLGCNMSCNHVFWTVKHGNKQVSAGSTWFKANYLPDLYVKLNAYAKKQLRRKKKLMVTARVCVHPPGPENFCKHHRILVRER